MLGLFTPGCQRGRLAGVDSWRVLAEQLLGNPVLVCPYGGALNSGTWMGLSSTDARAGLGSPGEDAGAGLGSPGENAGAGLGFPSEHRLGLCSGESGSKLGSPSEDAVRSLQAKHTTKVQEGPKLGSECGCRASLRGTSVSSLPFLLPRTSWLLTARGWRAAGCRRSSVVGAPLSPPGSSSQSDPDRNPRQPNVADRSLRQPH
eukprot:1195025-Prorocentrum_minimum.AAC.4